MKIEHNFKREWRTISGQITNVVFDEENERGRINKGFILSSSVPEIGGYYLYIWGDNKDSDNRTVSYTFPSEMDAQRWLDRLNSHKWVNNTQEEPIKEELPKRTWYVKREDLLKDNAILKKKAERLDKMEKENKRIKKSLDDNVEWLENALKKITEFERRVEEMEKIAKKYNSLTSSFSLPSKHKTIRGDVWNDVILDDLTFNKLNIAYNKNMPAVLEWPSWTWKSVMVRALAKSNKAAFTEFNFNGDTTVEHLLGHKILVGGDMVFEDWPLTDAVRTWKVFLGHEINATNPEVQFILNGLLERDDQGNLWNLSIQWNGNEVLKPHPNFRFFGTYNRGYLGTKSFWTSFMSRLSGIRISPLKRKEEVSLLQKKFPSLSIESINFLTILEEKLRNNKDFAYDVSTRDIKQALTFIEAGLSLKESIDFAIGESLQLDIEKKILEDTFISISS